MQTATLPSNATDPLVHRYLSAVALLGSILGDAKDAALVNKAVEASMDDPHPYQMLRMMVRGLTGKGRASRDELERHVENNPDDAKAQVVLATVLMKQDNPRWKPMAYRLLSTATDRSARQAARELLDTAQAVQA